MSVKKDRANSSQKKITRKMTREEVIQAVTEPGSMPLTEGKTLVIPPFVSEKADLGKIATGLNIGSDSRTYRILDLFCNGIKATAVDTKVLIQRIKTLSDEQLKILELICSAKDFTARNILESIHSLKRFGSDRLLALRAFVDLKDMGPGALNQFFMTTLPQGSKKEMGLEAYEDELKEKRFRPDQVTVFYNICNRVADVTAATAIALLPKARKIKRQHAQFINTFLKDEASFGDNPISDDNVLGLANLMLSLPELKDQDRFQRLIKKLSRNRKKKDFQFLIQSFKEEIGREQGNADGSFVSGIRRFFS